MSHGMSLGSETSTCGIRCTRTSFGAMLSGYLNRIGGLSGEASMVRILCPSTAIGRASDAPVTPGLSR